MLSPKQKRNISRIIPFGIIWLVTGWVLLLAETVATGNQNLNPDSAVTVTLPVFIFASLAITAVGLLIGLIELVVLEKRFRHYSFARKVGYKFIFYLALMLILQVILFPIASALDLGVSLFDKIVWEKTVLYFQSLVFVNTMFQLSFHLILSLLYAAISENLGHQVMFNFFTGKYHRPRVEERIFMFLDMKNSTTIAEKLGHIKYFDFLQMYYDAMTDPIINHLGEVYQYIGDEVVISWKKDQGLKDNNCIRCFQGIKDSLALMESQFKENYGIDPEFKAGIHVGEVTTGEIGALKKEIIFTGDVLNTTARIQALCNEHNVSLIISEELKDQLPDKILTQDLGEMTLKGKSQPTKIVAVEIA
ncbi:MULTISPECIES: adenylate/guanylate cyclase domain-containing protein [unclassified Ekhidna]|uniref:adenylate/guanylate cyclase domain-containing protein n=1 Tax=unclassified Ekhidna TaxID=2632188 RepID=UPI0032DEF564